MVFFCIMEVVINMVYLDYSATTPVNDEVIESYSNACKYIGNPNSLHRLGLESKKVMNLDEFLNEIAARVAKKG